MIIVLLTSQEFVRTMFYVCLIFCIFLDSANVAEEEWNPWEEDERVDSINVLQKRREAYRSYQEHIAKSRPKRYKVQIWGKAAIGLYLWEHILEGPLNPTVKTGHWREGEIQSGKINFRYQLSAIYLTRLFPNRITIYHLLSLCFHNSTGIGLKNSKFGSFFMKHLSSVEMSMIDTTFVSILIFRAMFKNIHQPKIIFSYSFYTGPAVVQGHVPLDTDSVVLVLNGREQQKISYSLQWLQHAQALVQAHTISRVAVVLLGSEQCTNDWISPYLKRQGGFVDLLFLVYDSPWVNDKDVFQWPLGVATYRDFPVVTPNTQMVSSARPYVCNFLGTVYKNSSREILMGILKQNDMEKQCLTNAREKWLPQETAETSRQYHTALAQSDLTLCPVGVNSECYRIYEACAYGSVPVVEDVLTPGSCADGRSSPLRLLKDAGAPFIFLKDWNELPALLKKEHVMTQAEKTERRMRLLEWYAGFRQQMKDKFTEVLEEGFFKLS
uniref:Ribitol xylosyltransferase 1 n=1 Tax=Electrophorus electricus TaxID=8005 RepID=A0A4W4FCE7_ELEEL